MVKKLKQIYAKQTLYQKVRLIILLFSIPSLVCLAVISLIVIWQSQISKVRDESVRDLQRRFGDMNYKMNTIELMAKTVWADTTFVTEVGKAAMDGSLREYDRYLFQTHTLSTLKVITSISEVQSARLHLEYPGLREYFSYVYSMDRAKDSLWYEDREALRSGGAWYLNSTDAQVYGTYSNYFVGKNRASFVIPVRINNNMTGIFEIALPMNSVVPGLYEVMEGRDVFLIDDRERLLGIEDASGLSGITPQELAELMGISDIGDYYGEGVRIFHGSWHGRPVMLSVIKDSGKGILLMQLAFVGEKYMMIALEIISILFVEIVLILLLFQAINGVVRHLLHDFDVFTMCIREVGDGNLNVEIPRLEQVEVNLVAEEYNRMLGRVRELMEISIHREVMVKEAQLKSLEKQINSHFLYNVLDSIKMMAEVRGIYNVSDALLALGRMFRYNLQIDSHSVTLQEEILYLENYLKLCNIRYDFYINLNEKIEDPVKTLKVPKVILQPIAENSISYGLDELTEDTTIYLKAYVKGECCHIEITDMGKGMDEEQLKRVQRGIESPSAGNDSCGGIGLANIHERIRLMYGEPYGVEIFSRKDCYTKVVLTIRVDSGADRDRQSAGKAGSLT